MKKYILLMLIGLILICGFSCGKKAETLELKTDIINLVIGNSDCRKIDVCDIVNLKNKKNASNISLSASNDFIEISGTTVTAKKVGTSSLVLKYNEIEKEVKVEVFEEKSFTSITDCDLIHYSGRVNIRKEDDEVWMDNSLSSLEFNFIGTKASISMEVTCNEEELALKVYVDGKESYVFFKRTTSNLVLAENLPYAVHNIKVVKIVEQRHLRLKLYNLRVDGKFLNNTYKKDYKFEFYGDSITCGVGANPNIGYLSFDEDATYAYPYLLAEHYNAEISSISYSGICASCPPNQFEKTTYEFFDTISAIDDTKYDFSIFQADIVFINLGSNDSSSSALDETLMYEGYLKLLKAIRNKQPNAFIICIYGNIGTNPKVNIPISNAVSKFMEEVDSNIIYKRIVSNMNGYQAHPDSFGQQMIYDELVDLIDSKNLLH